MQIAQALHKFLSYILLRYLSLLSCFLSLPYNCFWHDFFFRHVLSNCAIMIPQIPKGVQPGQLQVFRGKG